MLAFLFFYYSGSIFESAAFASECLSSLTPDLLEECLLEENLGEQLTFTQAPSALYSPIPIEKVLPMLADQRSIGLQIGYGFRTGEAPKVFYGLDLKEFVVLPIFKKGATLTLSPFSFQFTEKKVNQLDAAPFSFTLHRLSAREIDHEQELKHHRLSITPLHWYSNNNHLTGINPTIELLSLFTVDYAFNSGHQDHYTYGLEIGGSIPLNVKEFNANYATQEMLQAHLLAFYRLPFFDYFYVSTEGNAYINLNEEQTSQLHILSKAAFMVNSYSDIAITHSFTLTDDQSSHAIFVHLNFRPRF